MCGTALLSRPLLPDGSGEPSHTPSLPWRSTSSTRCHSRARLLQRNRGRNDPRNIPMTVDIKVPSAGESITEGTIARWLKPDGAMVQANEPILEIETDKAASEVIAPASGVLVIAAKEGDRVAVGAVVGKIDTEAKPSAKPEPKPAPKLAPAAPSADGRQGE